MNVAKYAHVVRMTTWHKELQKGGQWVPVEVKGDLLSWGPWQALWPLRVDCIGKRGIGVARNPDELRTLLDRLSEQSKIPYDVAKKAAENPHGQSRDSAFRVGGWRTQKTLSDIIKSI